MSNFQFSVVVCTYNPRPNYIERVLARLETQTLARDQWELVLVDNLSDPPLRSILTKIPAFSYRIVREETPGLVAARVRGYLESSGGWLVYVDDDNLLEQNYLEELRQLVAGHPHVALWSGEIHPEFEIQPPKQTMPFWEYLALREIKGTQWSNMPKSAPLPCGAGMAVRRDVIRKWVDNIKAGSAGSSLGRNKNSLLAGEDTDIGLTACDLGLGVGVSNALQLIHLIPARRVEAAYLRKLAYAVVYSHTFLDLVRRRVTFMDLVRRLVVFTGILVVRNRNSSGVSLWWARVSGVLSAWIHYQLMARSNQNTQIDANNREQR